MLPRFTIDVTAALAIVFGDLQRKGQLGTTELCGVRRNLGFLPWILVSVHRLLNLRIQSRANSQTVLDENLAQRIDADTLEKSVTAFQILSVLAVVLHEAPHVEQDVVMGVHGA